MVPFVWLEAHPHEKDVWKFVSAISGEQYVMTSGEPVMLMWLVGSLDTVGRVSIHMLSLCLSLLLWSRMSYINVQYLGCSLIPRPFPDFILQPWRKIRFSPQLRARILEWPGDEATWGVSL